MAARLHYDDHEYKTPKYYNFTENVESATRLPKDDSKARNYTTKSSPDPNFTFKQVILQTKLHRVLLFNGVSEADRQKNVPINSDQCPLIYYHT